MIRWLMLSMILRVSKDCILTLTMDRTNVLQEHGSRMISDTSVLSTMAPKAPKAPKATNESSTRSSK